MSVITVIKKIGEKILSVVEWPIKHSIMLAEMLHNFGKDEPAVKEVIVGLVQQFEAIGPDALAAIKARGFDVVQDAKIIGDVKSIFNYFTNTFLPVVETAYKDFEHVAELGADTVKATAAALEAATAPDPATPETQSGPGLHKVVPA